MTGLDTRFYAVEKARERMSAFQRRLNRIGKNADYEGDEHENYGEEEVDYAVLGSLPSKSHSVLWVYIGDKKECSRVADEMRKQGKNVTSYEIPGSIQTNLPRGELVEIVDEMITVEGTMINRKGKTVKTSAKLGKKAREITKFFREYDLSDVNCTEMPIKVCGISSC